MSAVRLKETNWIKFSRRRSIAFDGVFVFVVSLDVAIYRSCCWVPSSRFDVYQRKLSSNKSVFSLSYGRFERTRGYVADAKLWTTGVIAIRFWWRPIRGLFRSFRVPAEISLTFQWKSLCCYVGIWRTTVHYIDSSHAEQIISGHSLGASSQVNATVLWISRSYSVINFAFVFNLESHTGAVHRFLWKAEKLPRIDAKCADSDTVCVDALQHYNWERTICCTCFALFRSHSGK